MTPGLVFHRANPHFPPSCDWLPVSRITVAVVLALSVFTATAHAAEPKRVGWVEPIGLNEVGTVVRGKLDTGAKTSSIDAEIIDIRKTGKASKHATGDTVVFSITLEDGKKKTFERDVRRYVRIKKKGGGYIRRPVIGMSFCIADRLVHEEVNLANREGFIYPVLVGRNMMQHAKIVIDASKTLITRPTCDK